MCLLLQNINSNPSFSDDSEERNATHAGVEGRLAGEGDGVLRIGTKAGSWLLARSFSLSTAAVDSLPGIVYNVD